MLGTSALLDNVLTDADRELLARATEFGEKHFTEKNISAWCREGGIPEDTMHAFKDSGLGYIGLDDERYGRSVPFLTLVLILEEFSRISGTMLPINSQITTFNLLSKFADRDQIDYILDMYEKTARPCFSYAVSDANASSGFRTRPTRVEKKDGRIVLNGAKSFVSNGEYAPYILVFARNTIDAEDVPVNRAPTTLWLIPKDAPGITIFPIHNIGQKLLPSAAMEFVDVELDPTWQIGRKNLDRKQWSLAINFVRCTICTNSLGMAQAALEDAAHFAGNHIVEGKVIAEYGQVMERLADMQTSLYSMRSLTYETAYSIQTNGDDLELLTSVLKRFVPETAVRVANDGMRILGGIGYTDSARMSRLWIDSRGNQYATGTDEVMTALIARKLTQMYA